MKVNKTGKALSLMKRAAREDLIGEGMDGLARHSCQVAAQGLRNRAAELLHEEAPPPIVHGEALGPGTPAPFFDTLSNPDAPALEASYLRADLLQLGAVDLSGMALDAAKSIQAGNSLEKMLAHQMALAHASAFRLMDVALGQKDSVEQTRLVNASARMMRTFQDGLLTLQRLRTGGTQTVTVQHVHVGEGGQAVIGNVQAGGGAALGAGGEK